MAQNANNNESKGTTWGRSLDELVQELKSFLWRPSMRDFAFLVLLLGGWQYWTRPPSSRPTPQPPDDPKRPIIPEFEAPVGRDYQIQRLSDQRERLLREFEAKSVALDLTDPDKLGNGVFEGKTYSTVNMRGLHTTVSILFEDCDILGNVDTPNDCTVGCSPRRAIDGRDAVIGGSLEFRNCRILDPIDLSGARIDGYLRFDKTRVLAACPGGYALQASQIKIGARVEILNKTEMLGQLRFHTSVMKGLSIKDARLCVPEDASNAHHLSKALDLSFSEINGLVYIENLVSYGKLKFVQANILQTEIIGARLYSNDFRDPVILASGIRGQYFSIQNSRAGGKISLDGAKLATLIIKNVELEALNLRTAKIGNYGDDLVTIYSLKNNELFVDQITGNYRFKKEE